MAAKRRPCISASGDADASIADISEPMTKQNMNFAFYLVIGSSMQLPDEGLTTARLWEGRAVNISSAQ